MRPIAGPPPRSTSGMRRYSAVTMGSRVSREVMVSPSPITAGAHRRTRTASMSTSSPSCSASSPSTMGTTRDWKSVEYNQPARSANSPTRVKRTTSTVRENSRHRHPPTVKRDGGGGSEGGGASSVSASGSMAASGGRDSGVSAPVMMEDSVTGGAERA